MSNPKSYLYNLGRGSFISPKSDYNILGKTMFDLLRKKFSIQKGSTVWTDQAEIWKIEKDAERLVGMKMHKQWNLEP